jgi:hypothetical protein
MSPPFVVLVVGLLVAGCWFVGSLALRTWSHSRFCFVWFGFAEKESQICPVVYPPVL